MINENYTYDRKDNVVVTTLSEYVQYIAKLKSESEGSNYKFFFRGQANKNWDVRPSAFRDNTLAIEHDLILEACARVPFEFGEHKSSFERLTKLQHYGLPTRLLDVTLNPLVALYFACEMSEDIENVKFNYENESEPEDEIQTYTTTEVDGIIYYKKAYDYKYNSKEVDIISKLTETDLNKGEILSRLTNTIWNGLSITIQNINEPKAYEKFIELIQKNYFVTSTFNNERLIRQSGAFLLPGCLSVIENAEEYGNSLVQKTIDSLNKEFEPTTIIIPYNCKASILEELDFYNINKGSLFPELEHQMSYLRMTKGKYNKYTVGVFEKLSQSHEKQEDVVPENTAGCEVEDLNSQIKAIINKYIQDKPLQEGVFAIIAKEIIYVDWHTKEAIISEMRSNIKRYLIVRKVEPAYAGNYAKNIIKEIVDIYN